MAQAIPVIAAVASTAGTVYSISQSRRAAREQRRLAETQRKQRELQENRARRDVLRKLREARGRTINEGSLAGAGNSSGVSGAIGSIISQGTYNLSFLDQNSQLADVASRQLGRINNYQTNASIGSSVAGLGLNALSIYYNQNPPQNDTSGSETPKTKGDSNGG